jgi:hypothetical protein
LAKLREIDACMKIRSAVAACRLSVAKIEEAELNDRVPKCFNHRADVAQMRIIKHFRRRRVNLRIRGESVSRKNFVENGDENWNGTEMRAQ